MVAPFVITRLPILCLAMIDIASFNVDVNSRELLVGSHMTPYL